MASLKDTILGDVVGKVRDIIGRRRNGKYFIYATPREVKISNSAEAIKSRNIMIPLAKFAGIVNSIPELKNLWVISKIEASDAFHKIEKMNFHLLTYERPTLNNTIVPEVFSKNELDEASISSKGIKLKILINDNMKRAKDLTGIGVICYYNPKDEKMDYFRMSKISANPLEGKNEEQIDVEIPFNAEERSNFNSYLNSILYFTYVSKDNYEQPVKCLYNYRNEFRHEFEDEKERFSFRDSQP
jgi:hypothetical protein